MYATAVPYRDICHLQNERRRPARAERGDRAELAVPPLASELVLAPRPAACHGLTAGDANYIGSISASPTACPFARGMGVPVLKVTASERRSF